MSDQSENDEAQLLRDARAKANKLLEGMIAQSLDLERSTGAAQLASDRRAAGEAAFARAIEATRKTIEQLDRALKQTSGVSATED
jgi:hypothetical protein